MWKVALVVVAMVMMLAACSFGMQGVDPKWDGKQELECSDFPILIDQSMALGCFTAGLGTLTNGQDDVHTTVAALAIAVGAIYQISASTGSKKYVACQSAKSRWIFSNTIQTRKDQPAAAGSKVPATSVPPKAVALAVAPTSQPAAPRSAPRPWAAGVSSDAQAAALQLHAAGNQEFIQGRYSQALAKYKEAIRSWDHPAIRFNMAVCLINLDDPIAARDDLERSLAYGAAALGAESYAQALTYRKLLDQKLVRLTLDCPEPDEEVMLDGKLVFKGPGKIDQFVQPGAHVIVATKPGFLAASKKFIATAGEPLSFEIRPIVDPRP